MLNKIKCKFNKNSGFSIAELLIATLIMLLASSLIAEISVIARRRFMESTRESEAQLLASTIATSVQDTLTFAQNPRVKEGSYELAEFNDYRSGSGSLSSFKTMGYNNGVYNDTLDDRGHGEIVLVNEDEALLPYPMANHGMYAVGEANGGSLSAYLKVNYKASRYEVSVRVYPKNGDTELAAIDFVVNPSGENQVVAAEPSAPANLPTPIPEEELNPQFEVWLHGNGSGEGWTDDILKIKGDNVIKGATLLSIGAPIGATPRHSYQTCLGWYRSDGSKQERSALIDFTGLKNGDHVDFYAKYESKPITFTFDAGDGRFDTTKLNVADVTALAESIGDKQVKFNKKDASTLLRGGDYRQVYYSVQQKNIVPAIIPPSGMQFDGWYDGSANQSISFDVTVLEDDTTVVAHYKKADYTVILLGYGDIIPDANTFIVDNDMKSIKIEGDDNSYKNPGVINGWTLDGWYYWPGTPSDMNADYSAAVKVLDADGNLVNNGSNRFSLGSGSDIKFNLNADNTVYGKLTLHAKWVKAGGNRYEALSSGSIQTGVSLLIVAEDKYAMHNNTMAAVQVDVKTENGKKYIVLSDEQATNLEWKISKSGQYYNFAGKTNYLYLNDSSKDRNTYYLTTGGTNSINMVWNSSRIIGYSTATFTRYFYLIKLSGDNFITERTTGSKSSEYPDDVTSHGTALTFYVYKSGDSSEVTWETQPPAFEDTGD